MVNFKGENDGLLCLIRYILNAVGDLCKEKFYSTWGLNQERQQLTKHVWLLFCLFLTCSDYCEEAHSEVLMDPSESADKLKPMTFNLPAASTHSSNLYEGWTKQSSQQRKSLKANFFKNVTGEAFGVRVFNITASFSNTFKPKVTGCIWAEKTSFKFTNKSHPGEPGCHLGNWNQDMLLWLLVGSFVLF